MTVHSAKGLEFPYVFVAGMEENLFPSGGWMLTPQDLEEERRLFYVAITRAKQAVSLSFARTRMRNGKHESNPPSRFLREIAPQYLDHPLRKEDFDGPSAASSFGRGEDEGFRWSRPAAPLRPAAAEPVRVAPRPVTPAPAPAEKPPIVDPNFVPDPMSSFKPGDRIEHNRFGSGQILDISGTIPDLKARVRFDRYGEKQLLLKFAKLRHVK